MAQNLCHITRASSAPQFLEAREGLSVQSNYDSDFFEWTQQQADAVRRGAWDQIDREHLAEEIEDMWKADSTRLWHHLQEFLVWLLAYTYAPEQREVHSYWYVRVIGHRCEIDVVVGLWTNLAAQVEQRLMESYEQARKIACEETGLPPETFPETCPWTAKQVLNDTFWPEMSS